MNRHAIPIAAAALAVAAGCGNGGDKTASNPSRTVTDVSSPAPAQAGPPQALLGQYSRSVTKADIARTKKKRSELGPNQSAPKPERSLLFFEAGALTTRTPDASFVVQQDYSATSDGKLAIKGYQHPEAGSFCGPEIAQNATYTWKAAGNKLTLRATNDPCADRDSTLTGTWTKK
jgi:hypothetical protein